MRGSRAFSAVATDKVRYARNFGSSAGFTIVIFPNYSVVWTWDIPGASCSQIHDLLMFLQRLRASPARRAIPATPKSYCRTSKELWRCGALDLFCVTFCFWKDFKFLARKKSHWIGFLSHIFWELQRAMALAEWWRNRESLPMYNWDCSRSWIPPVEIP